MVTIPKSLQPPVKQILVKPPTIQERKLAKIPKPTPTQQLTPEQQKQIQEQETRIQKVGADISHWEQQLTQAEQDLKNIIEMGRARDFDVSDQVRNTQYRINQATDHLRELGRVQTQLKQGYIVGVDVSRIIEQKEREAIFLEKAKGRAEAKYQKKLKAWEQDILKQGFKPIYRDGSVVGFRDVVTKVSIPLEKIGQYLPEREQYLAPTPITPTIKPTKPEIERREWVGVTGKAIKYTTAFSPFGALSPQQQFYDIYKNLPVDIKKKTEYLIKQIIKKDIKSSPSVELYNKYNQLPPEAKQEIAKRTGKVISYAEPFIDPFVGLIGYKEISKAKPYIEKATPYIEKAKPYIEEGISTIAPFVKPYPQFTPFDIYRGGRRALPYAEKGIKKVSPYVEKGILALPTFAPIFEPYVQISGYGLGKEIYPYAKKGIEKAKPYIEKGVPYVSPLLTQYPQLTPFDIYRGGKRAVPYIEEGIKRAEPFVEKAVPYITPFIKPYRQISVGGMLMDIEMARSREFEVLEPRAKKLMEEINKLETLQGDERDKLIKKLKQQGVKFETKTDQITGEITSEISYPKWFEQLRPDFEKKELKEMYIPFFRRKLRYGIATNIAEVYQRGVFKGATLLEPTKPVKLTKEARYVGKGAGIGFELGTYITPYVAPVMFLGGTTEAVLKGKETLFKFTKEEPFEVGFAGVYGLGKGYRAVKTLKKTIKKPVIITKPIILPEQKPVSIISKPLEREITTDIFGKSIIKESRLIKGTAITTREGRRTIITTRVREKLGMKPIYEGFPYKNDQTYQKALEKLTKHGYSEPEAKSILRYRKPILTLTPYTAKANIFYVEEKEPVVKAIGVRIKQPLGIKTPTLRTSGKKGEVEFIETIGKKIGEEKGISKFISDVNIKRALLTKEQAPYSPLRLAGKTTTKYEQITGIKPVRSFELPTEDIFFGQRVEEFKGIAISKQILPLKRKKVVSDIGKVFIGEGEPSVTITKEAPIKVTKVSTKIEAIKKPTKIEITKERGEAIRQTLRRVYGEPTKEQIKEGKKVLISTIIQPVKKEVIKPVTITRKPVITTRQPISKTFEEFAKPKGGFLDFGKIKTGTIGVLSTRFDVREKAKEKVLVKKKVIVKEKALTKEKAIAGLISLPAVGLSERQAEELKQAQSQKMSMAMKTLQTQAMISPTAFTPLAPITKKPKEKPKRIKPFIPRGFFFPGEERIAKKKTIQGYYPEYLKEGTKPKKSKWVRVSDQPHTKQGAFDSASRKVDRDISARGRVAPIVATKTKKIAGKKKKVKSVKLYPMQDLVQGDDYYNRFRHKFRQFVQKKKVRKITPTSFIEKQPYRLDSPGEIFQIQKAKQISSLFFDNILRDGRGSPSSSPNSKKKRNKKQGFFRL